MKTLYINGNILTLDNHRVVDSLLEEDGIVKEVGCYEDFMCIKNKDLKVVDLEGKTMMPSFIDAHSHLSSYANSFLQVSLENANTFKEIEDLLYKFNQHQDATKDLWLIGNGYDHNKLEGRKHPTKELLDNAFPNKCVVLMHKSGHFGVMNTRALKHLGLEGKDKDGYLEENQWIEAIKELPLPSPKQLLNAYRKAFARYKSYGITTVQEGIMVKQMIPMVKLLLDKNAFELDVVGYPQIQEGNLFYDIFSDAVDGYVRNFRLGGYKIILDGSPQGKTAWISRPYIGSKDNYGVSSMTDGEVIDALQKAINDRRQILAHCNGDKACEQLLLAAGAMDNLDALRGIRPVIVHAQLLTKEQLDDVVKYGFIPSFFIAHTYYWGDTHIDNLGIDIARAISPANSAQKKGIIYTFHQDTPVVEPNMMETVWCAVNRLTRNGLVLGQDERISVEKALMAVTINAAYQYGEEDIKGTLTKGKHADFILLDRNPLDIAIDELKDVKVLKTYKDGLCIYSL